MLKWQIGDVTVTRVVEFESPVPYNKETPFFEEATPETLRTMTWLYPHFVQEDGTLNLSVHALLVEAKGLKLVVDTCVGNDKPRNMTGQRPLHRPFLQHIAEAGFPRESVNTVVCTHLHVDHVGWNTMLENGKWVPMIRIGLSAQSFSIAARVTRAACLSLSKLGDHSGCPICEG